MSNFRVALLQILPGDTQGQSLAIGLDACRRAKEMGADLALFPEMWNIGYRIPGDPAALRAAAITPQSDFLRAFAVVVQGNYHLAAVVAVDYAHLVGRRKPPLGGQSAPGVDKSRIADGQLQGYAGRNHCRRVGGNLNLALRAGIQIRACGVLAAVCRQFCALSYLLYVNLHVLLLTLYHGLFVPEYDFVPLERGLDEYSALIGRALEF